MSISGQESPAAQQSNSGQVKAAVSKISGNLVGKKQIVSELELKASETPNVQREPEVPGEEDAASISEKPKMSAQPALIKCKYGWLNFEPYWLQGFHRPSFLLVCMCYLAVVQGFIVNGVFPAITTQLERRFHIGSEEIGIINSMYDVGSLLMMVPISYFGTTGHKGRWIGIGTIVMGIGSFMCLVPHLGSGSYAYSMNKTGNDRCMDTNVTDDPGESSLENWKYMLMFGQILHGIGASPFYTMAITYMDENVSQHTSSMYVGIFNACSLLGPVLGYAFSALIITPTHVDFNKAGVDTTKITSNDPRWVGAWWLGMIVAGCAALIVSPVILGFGRKLPGADDARQHDVNQAYQVTAEDLAHAPSALRDCSCLGQRLKILIRNPTYVGLIIEQICTVFVTAGMVVFLTKYIEVQYGKSSKEAMIYAAGAAMPAAFFGVILGTIIQRFLRLHCNGNLVVSIMATAGSALCCATFFASCPTQLFAGVNSPYPLEIGGLSKLELNHSCHKTCGCTQSYYEPVCAAGNRTTLFSPCHAGCSVKGNSTMALESCSCLPNNGSVTQKICQNECPSAMFVVFMMFLFFMIFCIYIKQNPVLQATLRCVPFELRTFAVAIGWVPMRLFGSIPASPAMGAIVKATCLLWQERLGRREVCLLYDNYYLASYLQFTAVVGFSISFISLSVAWRLYRPVSTGEPTHGKEGGTLQESMQAPLSEGGIVRT